MPFGLAVDGKQPMSRFLQLRGTWVQEVASAATAVVTDAELQTDVKAIGRAYTQFESLRGGPRCRIPGPAACLGLSHVSCAASLRVLGSLREGMLTARAAPFHSQLATLQPPTQMAPPRPLS